MFNLSESKISLAKYKLLEKYSQFIGNKDNFPTQGIFNDASVYKTEDKNMLFSSSFFTEHIDFNLSYFPLKHLGYKIMVASMMNILSMNGVPKQVRIDAAFSNRFTEEAIDELMSGILLYCSKFKVDFAGLDFKTSTTGLTVAASIMGEVALGEEVYKSGAKENELICVTGDLGSAYTGLILLEREQKVFEADPTQQPDFIGVDYLLERYLKPEPPEKSWHPVIKPTSMLHLKDGLAAGLIQLCNASNLGCTIFEEKLPIDILTFNKLKELNMVATTIALNGGEDYEFLFTIKQEDYKKIDESKGVSIIGYMTPKTLGKHIITNDNKQFELKAQGF